MKLLRLLFVAVLSIFAANNVQADNLPKSGLVMQFVPFDSKYGPFHDRISHKQLQAYDRATGELSDAPKREKEGLMDGDYEWGFKLDSCQMFDTDLKLNRNSKMTILVRFLSNNDATTRGPIALIRSGQPDSLWYFPISVEKNRMIYMEGKPTPEDSVMVRSRWHYEIENGMMSAIFIQIDMKTGRHEIFMLDSASVFYNDRLAQLPELPNRILFTQQENVLINEFAVWNRHLTMAEMQNYYTGSYSKEYAAKHQMKEPVPIVGNIEEASGVMMHGWSWMRWGWTIGMVVLIILWGFRRFRNINVHYSFSGSPLIILAGLFGTWYMQSVKDFDVEYLWLFNTVQLLAYYFISFRADPLYTIRNAGGVGSVVNYVGGLFALLGEILDSIPHTIWEVTYVNRKTGEERKKIERHNNIIIAIFWFVVIVVVIWLFIILSEIIYLVLPLITIVKFIANYFKERKAFREAEEAKGTMR